MFPPALFPARLSRPLQSRAPLPAGPVLRAAPRGRRPSGQHTSRGDWGLGLGEVVFGWFLGVFWVLGGGCCCSSPTTSFDLTYLILSERCKTWNCVRLVLFNVDQSPALYCTKLAQHSWRNVVSRALSKVLLASQDHKIRVALPHCIHPPSIVLSRFYLQVRKTNGNTAAAQWAAHFLFRLFFSAQHTVFSERMTAGND